MKNIFKMLTGIITMFIASVSIGTTIPTKTATAGHSDFIVPLFSGYQAVQPFRKGNNPQRYRSGICL